MGVVAIVGRPNVGKSTLFNRLTGTRRAIVDEMAGLTRDRLYGVVEWGGKRFTLVDTAGLDVPLPATAAPDITALTRATQAQARMAIAEADVCCFMVDVRDGIDRAGRGDRADAAARWETGPARRQQGGQPASTAITPMSCTGSGSASRC